MNPVALSTLLSTLLNWAQVLALFFYTLKRLCQIAKQLGFPKNTFVYVMTDMVDQNIEDWQKRSEFEYYVNEGVLDFAKFDLQKDHEIQLIRGEKFFSEEVKHHTIFIANYVFDTPPYDLFRVTAKGLEEGLIKFDSELGTHADNESILLDDVDGGVTYRSAQLPYYNDPDLDAVLERYTTDNRYPELVFPIGSLMAIRKLEQISGQRLLLLTTDKGYSEHFEYYEPFQANLVFHGSFSMTLNFHAVGSYFNELGSDHYRQQTQNSIITSAFLLGLNFKHLPSTTRALEDYLNVFSSGNLLTLYEMIAATRFSCSVEHMVAYLTLSHWDPHVFNVYLDAILNSIKNVPIDKGLIYDLSAGMKKIAENVYQTTAQKHTFANIGLFFQEIQKYEEALVYYQEALNRGQTQDTTYYNMGLSYIFLNQPENALKYFRKAVDLNTNYILARGWISQIESKQ